MDGLNCEASLYVYIHYLHNSKKTIYIDYVYIY